MKREWEKSRIIFRFVGTSTSTYPDPYSQELSAERLVHTPLALGPPPNVSHPCTQANQDVLGSTRLGPGSLKAEALQTRMSFSGCGIPRPVVVIFSTKVR